MFKLGFFARRAKNTSRVPFVTGRVRGRRASTRIPGGAAEDFARDDFNNEGRYQGRRMSANDDPLDLTEQERVNAIRSSRNQYKSSGIYGAVLDRVIDFVMGDGVTVNISDPDSDADSEEIHPAQAWIEEVLERPENSWTRRLVGKFTRLCVDGELPLTVSAVERSPGQPSDVIVIGRVSPETIERVHVQELNEDHVVSVTVQPVDGAAVLELPIARPGGDMLRLQNGRPLPMSGEADATVNPEEEAERQREIEARDPDNAAATVAPGGGGRLRMSRSPIMLTAMLLWKVNSSGRRGAPLLTRILDKAELLDRAVEHVARKAEYVNRHWLITSYLPSTDAEKDKETEQQIDEWAGGFEPGANLTTTHDEEGVPKIKTELFAPDLKMDDVQALYDVLVDYILGAQGIPRHWYSSGGDTNRATATEQGTPIFRAIKGLQSYKATQIEDLYRFLLYVGEQAGVAACKNSASFDISVEMSDVATRDSLRDTEEVSGLGLVLEEAVRLGAISEEEAAGVMRRAMQAKAWGDGIEGDTLPEKPEREMPGDPTRKANEETDRLKDDATRDRNKDAA